MFIDKIIVINLDRAKERKNKLLSSFDRVGIKDGDVLFLSAFDSEFLNNDFDRKIFGVDMGRTFAKGEICCTISHIMAIKIAKSLNYKKILILEDDIEICDEFIDKINNLENQLPKEWDQIYIGAILSTLGEKITENLHTINTDCMLGTHSYLLNETAYDKITNKLLEFNSSTDGEYNILHKKKNIISYIHIPLMTYQYDGYSYITCSDKNMKNMTNKYYKQ
jgi:GR25 family glycosyltransferase involved in LPS biosynthesis